MHVLLGHAAVAPRGPPVCGCVHSTELVGKQPVLRSESRSSAPQPCQLESMKLKNQDQPQEHVAASGLSGPAEDCLGSPVLSGQVMRRAGKGPDDP